MNCRPEFLHLNTLMTPNDEVLNSWKEVAGYLGRGVRTVQRWEQELGLPVRRPRAKSRSAVIAFKSELDHWLHQASAEQLQKEHPDDVAPAIERIKVTRFERQARLHDSTALLITKSARHGAPDNRQCAAECQEPGSYDFRSPRRKYPQGTQDKDGAQAPGHRQLATIAS